MRTVDELLPSFPCAGQLLKLVQLADGGEPDRESACPLWCFAWCSDGGLLDVHEVLTDSCRTSTKRAAVVVVK